MNNTKLFTLEFNNKSIPVFRSNHTLTSRRGTFSRDHNLLKKDYKDFLVTALKYGLSSFRNKGKVVIGFKDTSGVKYSILVEFTEVITIVSVYYSTYHKDHRNNFIKEKNRINIQNYYTLDLHEEDKQVIFITAKPKKTKSTKKINKIRKIEKHKPQKYSIDDPIDYRDIMLFENSLKDL